jgi:hypothetical protein
VKLLVSGMIAGVPHQGGATWAVLQYLLGFRRLGHDVVFVEPCERSKLVPAGVPLSRSENAAYFSRVMSEFGLMDRAALLIDEDGETWGLPYPRLREEARTSDVLVNVSGMLTERELVAEIPVRVYLDLDPAFNQLWHSSGIDMRFDGHTHFVTVGQSIGAAGSTVPTCGRSWIGTLQPVVLERWPPGEQIRDDAFTTVGNWRGYGSIEHDGRHYGQRAHSLRELIALPKLTEERFLLALSIHPDEKKDLEALAEYGWELTDPAEVAGTPARYGDFIRGSRGELGIAKSGYVVSRCGWFSDRSACYLASGRPVIAQETGFSDFLPAGEGLFAFETVDGVLAALEELRADYDRHAKAARALAEDRLDSDRVLRELLERVGAGE